MKIKTVTIERTRNRPPAELVRFARKADDGRIETLDVDAPYLTMPAGTAAERAARDETEAVTMARVKELLDAGWAFVADLEQPEPAAEPAPKAKRPHGAKPAQENAPVSAETPATDPATAGDGEPAGE